jgi:hypothetical protein
MRRLPLTIKFLFSFFFFFFHLFVLSDNIKTHRYRRHRLILFCSGTHIQSHTYRIQLNRKNNDNESHRQHFDTIIHQTLIIDSWRGNTTYNIYEYVMFCYHILSSSNNLYSNILNILEENLTIICNYCSYDMFLSWSLFFFYCICWTFEFR